jgi:(2Fe-2S) ferredoxin
VKQHPTPFKCHLFVCTNTRDTGRKACGSAASDGLKAAIKGEIDRRGWKGMVRVSTSGCLGICEDGPNIMIYPQKIWLSGVSGDDLTGILAQVEAILQQERG